MYESDLANRLFGGSLYWNELRNMHPKRYVCGFCNDRVSSSRGYSLSSHSQSFSDSLYQKGVYICPSCGGPTFFDLNDKQLPGTLIVDSVEGIPEEIEFLYDEARKSYAAGAFTGSVLLSRKMLMNLAVIFGASEGETFVTYVDFLVNEGHVTRTSRDWVDHIRTEGNHATHRVEQKTAASAETLLRFIEMLLRINFEYPSRVPSEPQHD